MFWEGTPLHARPAATLMKALEAIRAYGNRYSNQKPIEFKAIAGFLFVRPECKIAQEDIIPHLNYYNERSSEAIDIFFLGYDDKAQEGSRKLTTSVDGEEWFFCDKLFNDARNDLERRTKWRYSGEADLLLANVSRINRDVGYHVDFDKVLCFDFGMMIRDKAIESVPRFFEDIFRFAERTCSADPVSSFSNAMGLKVVKKSIVASFWEHLKKLIRMDVSPMPHFAVRDVSK